MKAGEKEKKEMDCSVSMDRYYYSQDDKKINITLVCPQEKTPAYFKVEMRRQKNEKVFAEKQIKPSGNKEKYVVSFDASGWDFGRYFMTAHLRIGGREILYHCIFFRKKIVPAKLPPAAPNISIRSDGIILLNNKPFCIFFASPARRDRRSGLAKDCFNVNYGGIGHISRPLQRIDAGFPKWKWRGKEVYTLMPEEKKVFERIKKTVDVKKSDPLLLYWFISYEAQIPIYRVKREGEQLNNPAELKKAGDFIKSLDPGSLTAIQIDHGDWAPYKDSADIIEVASHASSYANHMITNLISDLLGIRNGLGKSKPFVFWVGSSIFCEKSAEEVRCAAYLALMYGAAGVVFHMGHKGIRPSVKRHWSVYAGLSREAEELFPILSSLQEPGNFNVTIEPAGNIDFCVRKYNNRVYLITANTLGDIIDANISITGSLAVSSNINILFENRHVASDGKCFSDTFAPFEPHVYEI